MKFWASFWLVFALVFTLLVAGFFLWGEPVSQKNGRELQPFPPSTPSEGYRQNDLSAEAKSATVSLPVNRQTWYRDQVVVLMYHHIAERPASRYAITPEQFAEHMNFLRENDLHPITLDEFLRFVDTGSLETENAVLITFDDGYESYYTEAFPVLKEYGFPSVNFVIAGRLRDTADRKREKMIPPLTHLQLKEMLRSGIVDIASHTYSLHGQGESSEWGLLESGTAPVYLEDLHRVEEDYEYRDRLFVDFQLSRVALEEILGKRVTSLSFPHGYNNEVVLEILKEAGFRYAFTSVPAVVKPGVDPYQIPRFDVGMSHIDVSRLHQLFTAARSHS